MLRLLLRAFSRLKLVRIERCGCETRYDGFGIDGAVHATGCSWTVPPRAFCAAHSLLNTFVRIHGGKVRHAFKSPATTYPQCIAARALRRSLQPAESMPAI